jgi:hypothetical protein
MSAALELLEDIVGINEAEELCHPFKGVRGDKRGYFSYTLSNDNTKFAAIGELDLRRMVESGEFNERGRIRMVPAGASSRAGAGGLSVFSYKGRVLPL